MSAMDNAKRAVSRCEDLKVLNELEGAIKRRREVIWAEHRAVAAAASWAAVKDLPTGTVLYCGTDGRFLGGQIQRGTKVTVRYTQPRAKRLWVTLPDGSSFWMEGNGITRYKWQTTPPEDPVSESEAKRMRELGDIMNAAVKP